MTESALSPDRPTVSRIRWQALRLAFGLCLLAAIVLQIGANEVLDGLWRISLVHLMVAWGLHVAALSVGVLRWQRLLREAGFRVRYRQLWGAQLVGFSINRVVPTTLGGDAVRAATLRATGVPLGSATACVLAERVIGLCVLLTVGISAALWTYGVRESLVLVAPLSALLVLVVGGTGLLALGRPIPPGAAMYHALRAASGFLRKTNPAVLSACALSAVAHVIVIAAFVVLARSVGIQISSAHFAAIVPAFFAVSVVPVTPSGLGLREGILVWWLAGLGVSAAAALTLALSWTIVTIATGLLGAVVAACGARSQPASTTERS